MSLVVAIVGATGVVGREMLHTLEQRDFPLTSLRLLASPRSVGTSLTFKGEALQVQVATPEAFKGVDVALFSAGASTSRELAPAAAAAGAVVIDNSSAWRMDDDVPLVVPEVNLESAKKPPKGIIANPNCSTIQLVVALAPIHRAAKLRHIVVTTFQASSGKGKAAVEELHNHLQAIANKQPFEPKVFPAHLMMNVVSDWKAGNDGYSEEELKIINETRKILGDNSIAVSPTTMRVPVVTGHSESVHVQCHRPISADEVKELLRNSPGIVVDDRDYAPGAHPQPIDSAGTDPVFVGRIRNDLGVPGAINMWVVADNLRKGAALNAVQIAEELFVRR
jgi:aspartate-semialdehyde dehydrogenase